MRAGLALALALVACETTPRDVPDDAAMLDDAELAPDAEADPYNRVVNRVLVDGERVYWSHGQEGCHLENPCRDDGPGMTSLWTNTGAAYVRYEGGVGTRFVTGTKDQMFWVTGQSADTMFVMRGGLYMPETGMSLARRDTVGPAVDATHVYWAEWSFTPTSESYTLKRTLRDGDASVVENVAVLPGTQMYKDAEIVHAGGYIWWAASGGIRRVPVTGGSSELIPQHATAIVASDTAIFVGTRNSMTEKTEIYRIDIDKTVTPLVVDAPAHWYKTVRFMVVVEDRVWWSAEDGNIYNVPTTGGALTTIPVGDDAGRAFVVLPDRFLVNLRFTSYRAIPR